VARYPSSAGYSFGPGGITPAVKVLIITNVVAFVLNLIVGPVMTLRLGLSPQAVIEQFAVWQPFTYMFLHSTSGFGHILFNMLGLWMFGSDLEEHWGTRQFMRFFFICGIGAGIIYTLAMPFVALTTAYVYFDTRARQELVDERSAAELPAEIELGASSG